MLLTRYIKSMVRFVLLIITVTAAATSAYPQAGTHYKRSIVTEPSSPDSIDLHVNGRKAFWRAAAETFGFNIGLWAFDRYVQKGRFAYISFNTIKENFKHGFEWDDDHLSTNMFAHPYNGSIYYNAGRSNGFNFWQSELFAIGGSAMWELFMEREYPSTNDIIATPIGGAAIGEVLYRSSDLILDDRSGGAERAGREIAAFIVNPMRGINRVITGTAWRRRPSSGRHFGIPPLSVSLSLGGRMLSVVEYDKSVEAGAVGEIDIEYGERYADRTRNPYDYFTFLIEVQAIRTQPVLSRVEIIGRLLSKEMTDRENLNVNIGLYQHFDYFDSDTIGPEKTKNWFPCKVPYKLGTPASVGAGLMVRSMPLPKFSLEGYAHLNGVLLAGILTDFYRDYHRNYSWGMGFSFKAGVHLNFRDDKVSLKLANQLYHIFTKNGFADDSDWTLSANGKPVEVKGDASSSWFNHFEASVDYRLSSKLYLTAGTDFYYRRTFYDDMKLTVGDTPGQGLTYNPIIDSKQLGCHLMLTCKF